MPMRKNKINFLSVLLPFWNDPKRLSNRPSPAIITQSGRGAVRLACLHGVQEVEGSNPFAPTKNHFGGFFIT